MHPGDYLVRDGETFYSLTADEYARSTAAPAPVTVGDTLSPLDEWAVRRMLADHAERHLRRPDHAFAVERDDLDLDTVSVHGQIGESGDYGYGGEWVSHHEAKVVLSVALREGRQASNLASAPDGLYLEIDLGDESLTGIINAVVAIATDRVAPDVGSRSGGQPDPHPSIAVGVAALLAVATTADERWALGLDDWALSEETGEWLRAFADRLTSNLDVPGVRFNGETQNEQAASALWAAARDANRSWKARADTDGLSSGTAEWIGRRSNQARNGDLAFEVPSVPAKGQES